MPSSLGPLSLAGIVAAILVAGSRAENTTVMDFTPTATYTTMSSLLVICPTTTQSELSTMSHMGSPVIETSPINHPQTMSSTSASTTGAVCMTVTVGQQVGIRETPVTTSHEGTKTAIFDGPLGDIVIVALTAYGIVVLLLLVIATLLVALGCTCKKHKSLRRLMNQQYTVNTLEHEVQSAREEVRYTSVENPMKDEPEIELTTHIHTEENAKVEPEIEPTIQAEENCRYAKVKPEIEPTIQAEENCHYAQVEPEIELTIQTEENCCYGRVTSHLYEDEDDYVISSISITRD